MNISFKKVKERLIKVVNKASGWDKRLAIKVFQLPNGLEETFLINNDQNSVQVFCITANGDVVLVEQFRPGREQLEIELPGGGMEAGEDPLKAGIRELLEETGYQGDATYMGSIPYSPYSTGIRHCVLVINAKKVENQELDPNEFVNVHLIPLRDFRDKIRKGKVRGFDLAYMSLDYIGHL